MQHNYHQLTFMDSQFSFRRKRSRTSKMLEDIKHFVEWGTIERQVAVIDRTGTPAGGRRPIPIDWKVKMLFVQHLYNLSDPELEEQMMDRLSFQEFVGITFNTEIPDFTTLWRFKEALIREKLLDGIFEIILHQLEARGLLVKKGTIVDATIIQSKNRPLSRQKRKELEEQPSAQIDTDASSTEKGGKKYFGYKGHVGVDVGSKLIRRCGFTTASEHDLKQFEAMLSGDERSVWADKAYPVDDAKRAARAEGIFYGVLDKGRRNHPLSTKQKKRNRKLARVRAAVEHPFAHLKTNLHYVRAVATNLPRNALRFMMNCVLYNVVRGNYLMKLSAATAAV
jgi:IS5 family transposase